MMQITDRIYALRIPFQVPVAAGMVLNRMVYAYIVLGDRVTIVDSGVSGSAGVIFNFLAKLGKPPKEIAQLILTHSHPDHLGGAKVLKAETGCAVLAHGGERSWIEDSERQLRERPVPGFHTLVEGSVSVDRVLAEGDRIESATDLSCRVIHTPGHSAGSISLYFEGEKTLITGDALPLPNDLPIFDDYAGSVQSVLKLQKLRDVENLLSAWEAPIRGREAIARRMDDALAYLRRIYQTVLISKQDGDEDIMDLCRKVIAGLGLPPEAVNPLVARTLMSIVNTLKEKN